MITLNDCFNAKIKGEYIICSKGHKLGQGEITASRREQPLVCRICQECLDFEPFDIPYKKEVK